MIKDIKVVEQLKTQRNNNRMWLFWGKLTTTHPNSSFFPLLMNVQQKNVHNFNGMTSGNELLDLDHQTFWARIFWDLLLVMFCHS